MRSRTREERLALLHAAQLYVCTDARTDRGDLADFLDAAYRGGVDIIQLRDKKISARDELAALKILADIAHHHGKLFSVNDRADIAALIGADIIHVGQEDLTPAQVRSLLGPDVLIGRSNRNTDMFRDSLADPDIDYAVMGPVWKTPTKPGRKPVGLAGISVAAQLSDNIRLQQKTHPKPWWAIGGIDQDNVHDVLSAGARRIVVVRAITQAADPQSAAQALKNTIRTWLA